MNKTTENKLQNYITEHLHEFSSKGIVEDTLRELYTTIADEIADEAVYSLHESIGDTEHSIRTEYAYQVALQQLGSFDPWLASHCVFL